MLTEIESLKSQYFAVIIRNESFCLYFYQQLHLLYLYFIRVVCQQSRLMIRAFYKSNQFFIAKISKSIIYNKINKEEQEDILVPWFQWQELSQ